MCCVSDSVCVPCLYFSRGNNDCFQGCPAVFVFCLLLFVFFDPNYCQDYSPLSLDAICSNYYIIMVVITANQRGRFLLSSSPD